MTLDIITLSFLLFIVSLAQTFIMFLVFRIMKHYPGTSYLFLSCLFSVLSGLLFAIRSYFPFENLFIIVGNFLALLCILFLNIGFGKFLDMTLPKRKFFCIIVLFFLSFTYYTYVSFHTGYRIIIISLLIALLSFMNAKTLLTHRIECVRATSRFLSIACISYGVFLLFRAVFAFFYHENELFGTGFFQVIVFLMCILGMFFWSYGFIVMTVQRERSEKNSAQEKYRQIFRAIPDIIFITNLETGEILDVNESYTQTMGYTKEESIGKTSLELSIWKNKKDRDNFVNIVMKNGYCRNMEMQILTKYGEELSSLISSSLMELNDKKYIISVIRNISQSKQIAKLLRKNEMTFKAIMEQSPYSVALMDKFGVFEYVNKKFLETTGYKIEEVIGQTQDKLKSPYHKDDFYSNIWNEVTLSGHFSGEICSRKKDGELFWENIKISPIIDENGTLLQYLSIQENITDKKMLEEELLYQARTDMLTGLMNRRYFMEMSEKRLLEQELPLNTTGFFMIDIDYFKSVNDRFGHAMGDKAICAVIQTCKTKLTTNDFFGRIGGEEFAALVIRESNSTLIELAEEMRSAVEHIDLFSEENEKISLTVSIGLTFYDQSKDCLDDLMKRSDSALYEAKNGGRNRYVVL